MRTLKTKNSLVKTDEEIKLMQKAGEICALALKRVVNNIRPGIPTLELDNIAREEIEKRGATSSFMTVEDYKWTICTTINEQVVHGIPSTRTLKSGDILSIDIGALYKGFHSDQAITVGVGKVDKGKRIFIETGRKVLEKAIKKVRVSNHIEDISSVIQEGIEGAGYSVVDSLTGHGIGRNLHEEPLVPGVGKKGKGPKIESNMVLAIEVIYAQGSGDVFIEKDGWTISTEDGTTGAVFEKTVAVKQGGPIVLTPYLDF